MNGRKETTILSVAEKPSVAKELARIIANNQQYQTKNTYSVYNKIFEIPNVNFMGQSNYSMKMTSVRGHLLEIEFDPKFKGWHSCQPIELFTAPIHKSIKPDCVDIQRTLEEEARKCSILLLWLDCDLEGENIGFEVIDICKKSNPNLVVHRARFSALIPRDIFRTLQLPENPNVHFNNAVEARQEIDLRLGAAFTRFQTLRLQKKFDLGSTVISYGPCQFPTLGFVVERYIQIQKFKPENYWSIACDYNWCEPNSTDRLICHFKWDRSCVYDHYTALILYENCLDSGHMNHINTNTANENNNPNTVNTNINHPFPPLLQQHQQQQQQQHQQRRQHQHQQHTSVETKVIKCDNRPTSRMRPCPMNTIELQKRASRFLNMGSDRTMEIGN